MISTPALPAAYLETAHLLADIAAPIARDFWFSAGTTSFKSDASALTAADTEIESRLRTIIAARHPDHGILGEEHGSTGLERDWVWVIDPIDGTRQFGARMLGFGVLIALCYRGQPVLGLMDQPVAGARVLGALGYDCTLNGVALRTGTATDLDDAILSLSNHNSFAPNYLHAYEALRPRGKMVVFDGGCLPYASLARGLVDLCVNGPDLEPFDICALVPIVREAGGVITLWDGSDPDITAHGGVIAACTPELHAQALAAMGV
ncbi:MAG: hypothetical protein N4A53_08365 [Pelagimonas sp.]|jgi:histidinol phosphatase-like enzyme (inositol monophosphatase family)|nr:hypothetical protein [Pelagimonas sp.]